jgi:hypothetical protein
MPVVVMGIGIQRKEGLKENLPAGTLKFLDVLRDKESFFLTRGYFTAEFLREQGMKFVKPTGCPSLYFNPNDMKRSLARSPIRSWRRPRRSPSAAISAALPIRSSMRMRCSSPTASQAMCPGRGGCLQPSLTGDDNDSPMTGRAARITGATRIQAFGEMAAEARAAGLFRHESVARGDVRSAISASAAVSMAASSACRPARPPS